MCYERCHCYHLSSFLSPLMAMLSVYRSMSDEARALATANMLSMLAGHPQMPPGIFPVATVAPTMPPGIQPSFPAPAVHDARRPAQSRAVTKSPSKAVVAGNVLVARSYLAASLPTDVAEPATCLICDHPIQVTLFQQFFTSTALCNTRVRPFHLPCVLSSNANGFIKIDIISL